MATECKICGDLLYVTKGKVRVPCKCARIKKLQAYFPQIDLFKVTKDSLREAIKQCKDLPSNKCLHLQTDLKEETLNLILLFYLLKLGSPGYTVMNSYELVEIYLEHHPKYKSILDISFDCVIILHGYYEMENRRSEDLMLQLFDHYRRQGKQVVFATRATLAPGSALLRYFQDHQWNKRVVTTEKMGSAYMR